LSYRPAGNPSAPRSNRDATRYRVSRCTVCFRSNLQYFFTRRRSDVLRLSRVAV